MEQLRWDIFISHASEDRESVAVPLASALREAGVRVWLDAHELKIGDSLSAKIDEGLAQSRFGAVIISTAFLSKHWPKKELSGLRAREVEDGKTILPIWHGVDRAEVLRFSPTLADALAANTAQGMSVVVEKLLDVIFDPASGSPATTNPPIALRFEQLLESNPEPEEVATFLSHHLKKRGAYIYEVPPGVWKPFHLNSVKFEGSATYAGHGGSLMLYRLCRLYADPFGPTGADRPSAAEPLRSALEEIRNLKDAFYADRSLHQVVREAIYTGPKGSHDIRDFTPNLGFAVFAGRRSFIDVNSDRQAAWTRLRTPWGIALKTYDALIDALRGEQGSTLT